MKKLFKWILTFVLTSFGILSITKMPAMATWDWYNVWTNWYWSWLNAHVWWVNTIWTSNTQEGGDARIIDTIRNAINWILWMLSLIALVLCLRWGFQMLTAAWDESKVKTWTKVLKHAAIWLAIIWLSWLLVSFIFRIVGKTTQQV